MGLAPPRSGQPRTPCGAAPAALLAAGHRFSTERHTPLRITPPRFIAPVLASLLASALAAATALAATPFPMASSNYSETFGDITNWTNNFASGVGAQYWASVPINATGVIGDGSRITVATTAFVTTTTGGVQKGAGNIQLLSTNGTDNINACAIDLLLDFTGVTAGTLSYDFATVINSTGNRNGSLKVFTSIDGTTFTELAAASVINFQNGVAFSNPIQQVTLPASFTNSATARIRFYDYNGTGPAGSSGARPKASIDNLAVTGTLIGSGGGPSGPVISNLQRTPSVPLDTSVVTVSATVIDTARVINAVSLAWGTSNVALTNVIAMAPTVGDTWATSTPIPAQVGGTTVYYRVTAVDDSVTVQSPVLNYVVGSTSGGSTSAPVITSVFQASDSTLQVFFNTPVDSASSQTASNYSVNGNVAVAAERDPLATNVVTVTVRGLLAGDRTLVANAVGDLASHFTVNASFGFHYIDVSIPAGYYNGTAGLKGYALLAALHNRIKAHTSITYSATATAFQRTDKKPNGKVWDVYSDIPGGTPPYEFSFGPLGSGASEGIAYNREHTFPQSWFGGSVLPMYSDLWVICPTDSKVNGVRGNVPYGVVGSATFTSLNGSKLGTSVTPGYGGTVFEPIDGYKGDLARSQFYVATRYFTEDASWPGSPATNRSQWLPWAATQLLQWSTNDPVSWKERLRNGAVAEYQNNRNPFIDHPEFVVAIYDSNSVAGVDPGAVPTSVLFRAATPNPFVSRTALAYELPSRGAVMLRVYDVTGRLVRSLVAGTVQEAGRYTIEWDGRDERGGAARAGLYFSRLEAVGRSDVRRLVRMN